MNARVTNIRFSPNMKAEIVAVAQGLAPILRRQSGFEGLQVLIDANEGEGLIVSLWETEADAQTSEANSAHIGQMSRMSNFLYGWLTPKTYEVSFRA